MVRETMQRVGVIGAGQMGQGIAQVLAQSEYLVRLYDVNAPALEKAQQVLESRLKRGAEKGKWTLEAATQALDRIESAEWESMADCDLFIEAATENPKIKFQVFKQLDELAKPSAILASNTSSISITEIAAATDRPSQVVGMHFMNPVPVMPLVEGISGLQTSEETLLAVQGVTERLGKTFIRVQDRPAFAVNRILIPMINEAIYAFYEGVASIEDIDKAMKLGTNQPMGPLELADFIGLDTCLAVMQVIADGLGDTKYRPCPLLKQYVKAGRLGRKTGRGFYEYAK